ncbi:Stathmin [Sergentomyia squamirostris]
MLIGLVRDSVLQCFCHTCRAPALTAVNRHTSKKATKARTKQPKSSKKVKFITTEIRCQEKSKGGLSYEVILAEPSITNPVPPVVIKRPITPGKKELSAEEIEEKLKAAEERRLSLEAKKMADWNAKMAKIEEASRKKDELNNEFMVHTKEVLEAKMEHYEEKREAIINDKKEKLKVHSQEIEKTRTSLEMQKSAELTAIEEKLRTAATLRDENMKKMLERLKEHERRAEIVRQNKAALCNQNENNAALSG